MSGTPRTASNRPEPNSPAYEPFPHNPTQATSQPVRPPTKSWFSRHQAVINFWLDLSLLIILVLLTWVGVIVRFVFPAATVAKGYTLWGFTLDRWLDLQFGLLALFCFGILLHLMLHWTWVCSIASRKILKRKGVVDDGQRTIAGVALIVLLLNIMGLGIAAAVLSIESPM